ncbi:MAG: hypothetical protein ACI8RD_012495, partial [Bacillariaceae sp.]
FFVRDVNLCGEKMIPFTQAVPKKSHPLIWKYPI